MASLLPLDDASGGFLRVHSRADSTAYHVVVKKKLGLLGIVGFLLFIALCNR